MEARFRKQGVTGHLDKPVRSRHGRRTKTVKEYTSMLFSVNTNTNGYIGPRTTRRAGSLLPSAVHGVTAAVSTPSNGERSAGPPGADQTQPRSPAPPRDLAASTPRTTQFAQGRRFDNGPPSEAEEILAWETRLKEQNLRPRANEEPPPDPGEAASASSRVQQLLREAGPYALAAQANQTARSVLYLLE